MEVEVWEGVLVGEDVGVWVTVEVEVSERDLLGDVVDVWVDDFVEVCVRVGEVDGVGLFVCGGVG